MSDKHDPREREELVQTAQRILASDGETEARTALSAQLDEPPNSDYINGIIRQAKRI